MKTNNNLFNKNYVINEGLLKEIKNLNLSVDEFALLVYFINSDNKKLDLQSISSHTPYKEDEILPIINLLVEKKLIDLISKKDGRGKLADYVSIEGLNDYLNNISNSSSAEQSKSDLYSVFEKEFGRTISSMEYEIINAWLDKGFSKDLILAALKEAVYNGVNNLRYIDKILFEWNKKGFKSPKDVDSFLKKESKKSKNDLFDYNWLDDEA